MMKTIVFFLTIFFTPFYGSIDWESTRREGWEGKSLSMTVFHDRLFLAHANPSNGKIFIATSADGNFREEATKIRDWVGGSLSMTVFHDRLFLAHANPSNGRIFIASSADGNFREEATKIRDWVGGSLSMAVFNNRLFLAHANPSNGRIFIASSADGNFQGEATKISNWVGGSLSMAAFYDHLFLVHANPNNGRIFIANGSITVNLTSELYDFRYPDRETILSRLQRNDDARLGLDHAMFDTIDIGKGCVGLEAAHNWSRTIRQEFSWGLDQRLGVAATVTTSAGLFGFGVQAKVSKNFSVGAHQDWRHSEDLTLAHSFRFAPQEEGIYKLGMFTVGMEGYDIPFQAKILFNGQYNDGTPASLPEIIRTIREKCPGVDNLVGRENTVVGNIAGTLRTRSAVDTMIVARKTL